MPSTRRGAIALLLTASFLIVSLGALTAPASAAAVDVRINEVRSDPTDTVELVNNGADAADLSGYVLKDDDDTHSLVLPGGTTVAAGGHLAVDIVGFGLGKGDSARLFAPDGTTLVDATTWPAGTHATTWGRCPDGTGAFGVMTASLGSANTCATPDSAVRINELSSNNPDFVELVNTGTGPVDLSGWVLKDSTDNNAYTFPAGSTIAAGAHQVLNGESVDFVFGLGNGDAARLYADTDLTTPLDSYAYPAHPAAGKSYGRCPDATGPFEVTAAATKGAVNQCAVPAGGENVKINEVQSDPGDLVELTNIGETTVDLSGYVLKDDDDSHAFAIAAGTSLAPHAYVVLDVNASFGLGKGDSVRLYQPNLANLLDSTTYAAGTHATDWGRCPNGTGDFGVVTQTLGSANACGGGEPSTPDVVVNEVESNGDQVADWVELKNRSGAPVNVSGWKILDSDPAHAATPVVVPAGTTIPAGGYYALYTEISQSPGFGLGVGDSVTLLLPDGTTQVDSTTWGAHAATTWGRCPDGTGAFGETTTPTRGLPNACSPIRINEIESDGGDPADWVELANISASPVDVGGLVVKDSDDAHAYTIPAPTSLPAKGYLVLDEGDLGFTLDDVDAVRLFDPDGTTLIEQYAWAAPAAQSYARCKDGVGDFTDAKAPTRGAVNSCPGLDSSPWPGSQSVSYADLADTFLQDLSGLAFDPTDSDVLWAAQNKKGTLFKLTRDADDHFVPASGWPKDPRYVDGTGAPDTEGITIGPDGFVYLAAERNNAASGVSRMSILRYDPAAAGSTIPATNEWNLTGQIPAAGANLGLEGVAFVPDAFLTGHGFRDQSTGEAYTPQTYPGHGSGLFVVAVEATGDLIAFALDDDGTTAHKVATIDSGFAHLADVSFDPERQRLWAVTDDTHDGTTSLLRVDDAGDFVVDTAYDRPVGMPNLNNEGLAIAPRSACVDGSKEVLWSDDGDTDGHSLRRGTITCTPRTAQPVEVTPGPPAAPVVGQTWELTATGGGSGNPVVLTVDGTCAIEGTTVTFTHPGTCTVRADQAGDASYADGSVSHEVTVTAASTTTAATIGADEQQATVTVVAPGAGTPTGSVTFSSGGTPLGSAPLVGGVATLAQSLPADADELTATYSGDDDFAGSSDDAVRTDPTIAASVSPARPGSGWWRTPVTVTFTCAAGSAGLVDGCPGPVTLATSGANQVVTRTVAAVDGGSASVTVADLDLDRARPAVRVAGVRDGSTYRVPPKPVCRAVDALSGVRTCTLHRTSTRVKNGTRYVVVARATDRAGNEGVDRVTYRVGKRRQ
ncbi:lamin tail domain-containing protein [Nocardioides sp.]|uniref:lamin tail domain-containing protein n=1 Tax=Nocardioides sp. TaxID=35761 RepID=UPI0037837678